ncbi:MAG: hypothetical protein BA861_00725 [Desulfobacterales bacterium S3730MH5]|nr:MAG: hypothetical protein BA861_00725 [Desulfobacterales bacterium S3730MH5]
MCGSVAHPILNTQSGVSRRWLAPPAQLEYGTAHTDHKQNLLFHHSSFHVIRKFLNKNSSKTMRKSKKSLINLQKPD